MESDTTYFPPPADGKFGDCYVDARSRAVHFHDGKEWQMYPEADLVGQEIVDILRGVGYSDAASTEIVEKMLQTLIKTRDKNYEIVK